ncbi:Hpt domain-containing protein [uncultured Photobacterium sp.]|uniref:Hpt domain-containing protein n=1 Tax=uncultured Photobacterium sp. TaxID=173973 RepID=UPI00262C0D98|nr:Hpt domain-containing protein [uncultured Photobacterium sp.]
MDDKRTREVKKHLPEAKFSNKQFSTSSKRFLLSFWLLITMFFVGCILLVACFAALTLYLPDSSQLKLFWFDTNVLSLPVLLGAMMVITALLAFSYGLLKQRLKLENDVNVHLLPLYYFSHSDNTGSESVEGLALVEDTGVKETNVVLDYELLLENMDGDFDAVRMLLEIFLDEHNDDASLLSEFMLKGQGEDACRVVHSLKGVASSLEAKQLRDVAEKIEREIKQGKPANTEDIGVLNEAITALNAEIVRLLQSEPLAEQDYAGAIEIEKPVSVAFNKKTPVEDAIVVGADLPVARSSSIPEITLPILNVDYLLDSMDDDQEAARILLEIFIAEHADDARKLTLLVGDNPPESLCEKALRLVHSLKGVAGNIGAEALKQQAVTIEAKYKQQQVVEQHEYRRFEILLENTVSEANHYLAELPTEMV